MAYHKNRLGRFGDNVQADIHGYVPTADTGPWELTYDHGSEDTHDDHGNLTEYGEWWEYERFPAIKAEAIRATAMAEAGIKDWQGRVELR